MRNLAPLLLRLLARLPLRAVHGIGAAVGWAHALLPSKRRRVTAVNLARCLPDLAPYARARLLRRSLVESGKAVAESAALWLWEPERVLSLVRAAEGQEILDDAFARGRGVILAIPHLGAWEFLGLYCSARYPMTSLYRPQRPAVDAVIRRGRERLGARLVPTDAGGVRALYAALRRGEVLGMLPDHDPGRTGGVFAPFFGVTANTVVLPLRLVRKTGASVVFAYAERLPAARGYRIHFLPAPEGIDDPDPQVAAARLNEGLERCIRRLPEQYWWSYKRFRTRPPGEPSFY